MKINMHSSCIVSTSRQAEAGGHGQLLAIRGFARVVEAGSFTRAADSLDIPNTSLSNLVQELEGAHLGVRLLQRTHAPCHGHAGRAGVYEKTLLLLRDLEDIDTSFNAAPQQTQRNLRIDVSGSTARERC